ncbi:hypothetical protein [Futiania mangrovi]|uniref:Integrase n=1 Tax=Futiania mangrovi TaxID=2959716 RepID=A0A9J6PB93_9PROT|nr:hypothetical protein [Futiania mangrovii]MCP1337396.1 integrase [Futiania mangrovii]
MKVDLPSLLVQGAKLLALCLVVGLVLAFLGLDDPWEVWGRIMRAVTDIFENFGDWARWAWGYILLGAGIVIPVVLIRLALRMTRRGP